MAHNAYGKTHEYYLVSFFASDRDITLGEMEEIRELLNEEIEKHKGHEND